MPLAIHADTPAARILVVLAACVLTMTGCSSDERTPPTQRSEGPLIYWNEDVRAFDADGDQFAAITIGLSALEVLERGPDGKWQSTMVSRPHVDACSPFPITNTVADANNDGALDILVFDAACGNWIALGRQDHTGFDPVVWEDILPELQPAPYLGILAMPQSEIVVFASNGYNGQTLTLPQPAEAEPLEWRASRLQVSVTRLIVPGVSDDGTAILQGNGELLSIPVKAAADVVPISYEQQVQRPYLEPFSGFDGLTRIDVPDCGPVYIGQGLFPDTAGIDTRNLQVLAFNDTTYIPHEVDRELDVHAFAAVTRQIERDTLALTIGNRAHGKLQLSLWKIVDCATASLLAERNVTFDWTTPKQEKEGRTVEIPKTRGIKVITALDAAEVRFEMIHYDGLRVRTYTAHDELGEWTLSEDTQKIHDNRVDFAF